MKQTRLAEKIFGELRRKTQMLYDHYYECVSKGTDIPNALIRWDENKNELVIEIYGSGTRKRKVPWV